MSRTLDKLQTHLEKAHSNVYATNCGICSKFGVDICFSFRSKSGLVPGPYLDDNGLEVVELWPLEDGAERHDAGVPVAPVGVFDVLFDERQDVRNHVILAAGGQQHQAHAGGFTGVPVVIIVVLILRTGQGQGSRVRVRVEVKVSQSGTS